MFVFRPRLLPFLLLTTLARAATPALPPAEPMDRFVTRDGDQLMLGDTPYRFVSANLPDVLQIITNYEFTNDAETDRYRIPDAFEQRDALRTIRQMGGRVARTFVLTHSTTGSPAAMFHLTPDGVVANETALVALDRLLQIGREEGVRLLIPFIAYNSAVRGDPTSYGEDFWKVGSPDNHRFKAMLTLLLNRTNSLNGIPYRDDPTVFGWHTGNELVIGDDADRRAWLHDIAAFIKHLAPHQLLIDGRNRPWDVYNHYDEFLDDPNIDAVSYHTYQNLPEADTPAGTLRLIRDQVRGKKPLIVTEVAMYTSPAALRELLDEIDQDGTVGAMWWGIRFHNRDGGFYKHSDRDSKFEDLNWPGFDDPRVEIPEIARERELLGILHTYAPRLSGLPPVPTVAPEAPHLLPIPDPGHISWQGSAGASNYDVQRATSADGPWLTVGAALGDHLATYTPLFCDETAPPNAASYYRVIAGNGAGESPPSNVIGPVRPAMRWIVDDVIDESHWAASTNLKLLLTYAHTAFQEDVGVAQRAAPASAGRVTYRVPGALRQATIFMRATENGGPQFRLVGPDGQRRAVEPPSQSFADGQRIRYDLTTDDDATVGIEIELPAATSPELAISRVELAWTPAP